MNWGTELWDQYENLSIHTHKGIDFLDKYGNFVKDRCAIELEYAGKLRRLIKNYQPKRKEEEEYQFSSCKAFVLLLNELGDFAGQREVVAENLQATVISKLQLLAKELRDERKKYLNEGAKETSLLGAQLASLDRAKKQYDKSARESERALEAFHKADADLYLSRAEVEKQKSNMKAKAQQCEDAKLEYADQLRKTNESQRQHYEQRLPAVFKQLQDLDEKRIKNVKSFMLSSVEIESNVLPIIQQCLNGMKNAANSINEKEDTHLVIERYKSGFFPPGDHPFEEYSSNNDSTDAPAHHNHMTAARGTISGGKIRKRVGLFSIFGSNKNNISMDAKEDFSDLPPNQKRKRLAAKVQELSKQVAQEQAAMDGLMKMKGVYEANPSLGDAMTVEGQLNESSHKLEKLKAQLNKFQTLLKEAMGETQLQHARLNGSSTKLPDTAPSIGSNNSESLSRSGSDSSVSTAAGNGRAGASPESGLGGEGAEHTTHVTSHDTHNGGDSHHEEDGDYYYEPELQPLGYCKALYPFEATSAGSMAMACGERLLVVEVDAGDGWTRVRRQETQEEGFVPTTYIATTLYADAR